MSNLIDSLQAIGALSTGVGLGVGVYQYYQAERFKRMQKLFDLFAVFRDSSNYVNFFALNEALVDDPENHTIQERIKGNNEQDDQIKYQYLALLEEVALFADSRLIRREDAIYMFHFHFFYVFGDCIQSQLFWERLGGRSEIKKESWARAYAFAQRCFAQVPAELKAKVALK